MADRNAAPPFSSEELFLLILNRDTLDHWRDIIRQDWPEPERYHLRETCWFGSVVGVPLRDPTVPWQIGAIQKMDGQARFPSRREKETVRARQVPSPPPSAAERNQAISSVRWSDLPNQWDWSERRPCPLDPPEQQGTCAACVSFAVATAIETTARIRTNRADLPSLSEAEFFFNGNGRCWEGWNLDRALERARDVGLVPRHLDPDPYDGFQQGPRTVLGPRTRPRSYRYIDIDAVEEAMEFLRNRGPLIHQSHVARDFFLYDHGIYRPRRDRNLMHCYVVVGYDRRMRAWKCRNHFGRNWGEAGHFWLPFDWGWLGEDAEEDDCYVGIEDFQSIAGL